MKIFARIFTFTFTLISTLILTTLLILFSSCSDSGHFLFEDPYFFHSVEPSRYPVFFESDPMQLAMFEPVLGTFIGMHSDALPNLDDRVIGPLESYLGVSHATFMEVMYLGDDFPFLWVLECIAGQKAPVIVIQPGPDSDPFGSHWEEILTETATQFAELPVPMFVVFYPVPANSGWDPAIYIAFFRYARALFADLAPHAAFIWAVDGELENYMDFFPGNLAADWVGISLFASSYNIMAAPTLEIPDQFLSFYHSFQKEFPIMLNVGLSHFSTKDHRYRISETAAALEQLYGLIQRDFPRIKMVNYMDLNQLDYNGQDYRISVDTALRSAYRDSIQGFITEMPQNFDDALVPQPIRSAYTAFVKEGRIYLDIRILTEGIPGSIINREGYLDKNRSRSMSEWLDGAWRINANHLPIRARVYQGHVRIS